MVNDKPYQVTCYSTLDQLESIASDWDALCESIPQAPIFTSRDWLVTWWRFFGQGRELYILAARDETGSLRGLAPWMIDRRRWAIIKLRALAFIGTGLVYPVHLDLLARAQEQGLVLAAFRDYLAEHSGEWDVLDLAAVAQDSVLNGLSANGAALGSQVTSPYITLPGDWDAYLQTRSKKLRRNLRYFRTKLENDYPGQVSFNQVADSARCQEVVQRLCELNRNRRHAQGLASAFEQDAFREFLVAIVQLSLLKDSLRLFYLSVGDTIIAVFCCFHYHGRYYAYQMGFDIAWYDFSPGRLLIAHGIKSAIQEGAYELDWLAGNDEYKLAWTEQARVEDQVLLGNSWRGKAWMRAGSIKASIISLAKRWLSQPTLAKLQHIQARWRKPQTLADNKEAQPSEPGQ